VKAPRLPGEPGKGSYWTVSLDHQEQAQQITLKNGKQVLRRSRDRAPFGLGAPAGMSFGGPASMDAYGYPGASFAYGIGYPGMGGMNMHAHSAMHLTPYAPPAYPMQQGHSSGTATKMEIEPSASGFAPPVWSTRDGSSDMLLGFEGTGLTPRKDRLDLPPGLSPHFDDFSALMVTPMSLRARDDPSGLLARGGLDHLSSPSKLLWSAHAQPMLPGESTMTPGRLEWPIASPLGLPDWDLGSPGAVRASSTPMRGLPRFDA
jgi:hypothetical protein